MGPSSLYYWKTVTRDTFIAGNVEVILSKQPFYTRLQTLCVPGEKTRVRMNTGARLLSFNSSSVMDGSSSFSCHLELYHSSVNFGFFVFIQEMELSGSTAGGCHEDFLQFGRDILFVTTHLSERYCGKVERPRLKTNLAGASSQISHRTDH